MRSMLTEAPASATEGQFAASGHHGGGPGPGAVALPQRPGGADSRQRAYPLGGDLTIKLAKEFGFCYGVERAIDLAYAARRAYPDRRIFLLGEIIHNPEVNDQLRRMGIVTTSPASPGTRRSTSCGRRTS